MIAEQDLPPLALSVRQPWAWAIIHGGKVIENRSRGSVEAGNMVCGRIAIHAAGGMREKEYRWAAWKMAQIGVVIPRPEMLVRSAIIGAVNVVDIITESDSPWFGGPCGLVLEDPVACEPVPSKGALGYFEWKREGALAPPTAWMARFDAGTREGETLSLFPHLPPSFELPPEKPFKGYGQK